MQFTRSVVPKRTRKKTGGAYGAPPEMYNLN